MTASDAALHELLAPSRTIAVGGHSEKPALDSPSNAQ